MAVAMLKKQNRILSTHANSSIYTALAQLVDFTGTIELNCLYYPSLYFQLSSDKDKTKMHSFSIKCEIEIYSLYKNVDA